MKVIECKNRMEYAREIIKCKKNGYSITFEGVGETIMRKNIRGLVKIVIRKTEGEEA